MWFKSKGASTGTATTGASDLKDGAVTAGQDKLDQFINSPAFPTAVGAAVLAAVGVFAWPRLPKLRYVLIGGAIVMAFMASTGKM
ncbi:MAG TPA: hypothetical protein VLS45_09930 [Methylomicrobium sp.]|nr:hypothetical protein [Methylomicrobium sp.]